MFIFVCLTMMTGMTLSLGPVEVIIGEYPTITGATPDAKTVLTGDSFTFSVEATGDPVLTYQWLHNGEELEGQSGAELVVDSATLSHAGDYICRVTSGLGCSSYSLKGTLSVDQRLLFTQHPSNATKTFGESLVLQAEAIGVGSISYTWEKDGELVPGATSRILYIESLTLDDAGSYVCLATDSRVPPQEATSEAGIVVVNLLPPHFTLTYREEDEELMVVFNNHGVSLDEITSDVLPSGTVWGDVVSMGINFVDRDTWEEVLEGHPLTVVENQDTNELVFTGAGVDWEGNPGQANLADFDGYILSWFEVDTNPGERYFVNANMAVTEVDGEGLNNEFGMYRLLLP